MCCVSIRCAWPRCLPVPVPGVTQPFTRPTCGPRCAVHERTLMRHNDLRSCLGWHSGHGMKLTVSYTVRSCDFGPLFSACPTWRHTWRAVASRIPDGLGLLFNECSAQKMPVAGVRSYAVHRFCSRLVNTTAQRSCILHEPHRKRQHLPSFSSRSVVISRK